jgi:hypothetical protein
MQKIIPVTLLVMMLASAGMRADRANSRAARRLKAAAWTAPDKNWIARSNQYAQMLLDVGMKHSPEAASRQGLAQFDEEIERPTRQDEEQSVAEQKAVVAKFEAQLPREQDKDVKEDLEIMIHAEQLYFKVHDFFERREVR